jgi:formylglycine-generating enzyme required for sulfatase activity
MLRMNGDVEEWVESWERIHRDVSGKGPQPRKAKRVFEVVGLVEWIAESSIWVRST